MIYHIYQNVCEVTTCLSTSNFAMFSFELETYDTTKMKVRCPVEVNVLFKIKNLFLQAFVKISILS